MTHTRSILLVTVAAALTLMTAILFLLRPARSTAIVPSFSVPVGQVREPLPYRIVSFHRGRADKNLILLARQLGFNGVQFQIEGPNEGGIADFAARDRREHLVDYCHSLGMSVTVWVRELSDLPATYMPEYLGPVSTTNTRLWQKLEDRYDWVLSQAIPNVDGLVLTVVETQVRATSTPIMLKLVDLVSRKCQKYGKSFIFRTFVWHPEELAEVMAGVSQLPRDMVIMSKIVPQDWQMRGALAAEVGAVGGRPQIIEFDAAGEYFLKGDVANCMPDLLHRQFDALVAKGARGICVRVDRDDFNVLFQPQEVNLWALGLLAAGASDSTEDIWRRWVAYRYPDAAADAILRALKPTEAVIAEMLSIGPFTHGDTRSFPALPNDALFETNWQNWRWDRSYLPTYDQATAGDPAFISQVTRHKAAALLLADRCLMDLEGALPHLLPVEYAILKTKLLTNKIQLQFRSAMILFTLRYRLLQNTAAEADREALRALCLQDLATIRALADTLSSYTLVEADHLGRRWPLNAPQGVTREQLYRWCYQSEQLLD